MTTMTTMTTTKKHDEQIANMIFGSVYPLYVDKVVKKGRTVEELNQLIEWLTGFSEAQVRAHIESKSTIKEFFADAKIHTNARFITGVICGYRIEEIKTRLTKKARYLDKLVDELAKGRKMEKILRKAQEA